jgi:hypothetical protein
MARQCIPVPTCCPQHADDVEPSPPCVSPLELGDQPCHDCKTTTHSKHMHRWSAASIQTAAFVCVLIAGVLSDYYSRESCKRNSTMCQLQSPASPSPSKAPALQLHCSASVRPHTLTGKDATEEHQVAECHVSKVGSFHATDLVIMVCEVWIIEGREIGGTWEVHCCSGCCCCLGLRCCLAAHRPWIHPLKISNCSLHQQSNWHNLSLRVGGLGGIMQDTTTAPSSGKFPYVRIRHEE